MNKLIAINADTATVIVYAASAGAMADQLCKDAQGIAAALKNITGQTFRVEVR